MSRLPQNFGTASCNEARHDGLGGMSNTAHTTKPGEPDERIASDVVKGVSNTAHTTKPQEPGE
jgi:hypothetical protein